MKTDLKAKVKPFIQTYSGIQFWDPPTPAMVVIDDIAHALSMNCRYAGHTHQFYSVAQHSCLMHDKLREVTDLREILLWSLVHDATEAYIADIPRPFKPLIQGYADIEEKLMQVVALRFDLEYPMPDIVHRYDGLILFNESTLLGHPPCDDWHLQFAPGIGIEGFDEWLPEQGKNEWLNRVGLYGV
jgi:hypothetical protein